MRSLLGKLSSLLTRGQRRKAFTLMVLLLVGMGLETLGVGLVVPALAVITNPDMVIAHPKMRAFIQSFGGMTQGEMIQLAMLTLIAIYLVKNLFLALLAWRQTKFAYSVQAQLSQRLFAAYLRQPYTFHLQRNSAQLIRNVASETAMFTDAIMSAMLIASEVLVIGGIAILLLAVEPVGASIVVAVLGSAAWIFFRLTRGSASRWGAERLYHDGMRMQHLQQGLGGAKDVKLLGREREFLVQYEHHSNRSAGVAQLQATMLLLPRLWLEFLAVVGLATLVIAMVLSGRSILNIVPLLGLFAAAAFRLMPSVNRILAGVQTLRYNTPAIANLHSELLTAPVGKNSEAECAGGSRRLAFTRELVLHEISYTYQSTESPAISRLSLIVRRGESIGIIGESGSGKSTLIDILLGLLDPASGSIRVDDRDIKTCLRQWQDQIGYVPQSIFLTDDSLRRNVAFGIRDDMIDEEAVRRSIKAAQLQDFAATLKEGLNTIVGERGVRLSGGQRQRIGIARALYHDPAILVLDEATSSLDAGTERGVMAAVTALHGTKTILIVAHRMSTVENCDRLYRLDKGLVVSEGRPDEVLCVSNA